MKSFFTDVIYARKSIYIMRITAVYNYITRRNQGKKGIDYIIHRLAGRHEHHYFSRNLKILYHFSQGVDSLHCCSRCGRCLK